MRTNSSQAEDTVVDPLLAALGFPGGGHARGAARLAPLRRAGARDNCASRLDARRLEITLAGPNERRGPVTGVAAVVDGVHCRARVCARLGSGRFEPSRWHASAQRAAALCRCCRRRRRLVRTAAFHPGAAPYSWGGANVAALDGASIDLVHSS
jgi:hypothetical protein